MVASEARESVRRAETSPAGWLLAREVVGVVVVVVVVGGESLPPFYFVCLTGDSG